MIPALQQDLEAIARFQRVVAQIREASDELAADNAAAEIGRCAQCGRIAVEPVNSSRGPVCLWHVEVDA